MAQAEVKANEVLEGTYELREGIHKLHQTLQTGLLK